jgi:hypothetical protein
MNAKRKHPKRPRNINLRAASTVALATGQLTQEASEVREVPEPTPEERHVAAVMLGRKGGQARAKKLTPERKQEIAHEAARARWARKG